MAMHAPRGTALLVSGLALLAFAYVGWTVESTVLSPTALHDATPELLAQVELPLEKVNDIVREQRDTTGYALVKDAARIRTLAERGASVDGLARVFGLPEDEIERILATSPATD